MIQASLKGELPEYIKQYGYIATRNDDYYIVEYIVGGHDPCEVTYHHR